MKNFNEYRKIWDSNNRSLKKINTKRTELKHKLIKFGVLPESYPYTKHHEELMDMLKSNDFKEIREIIKQKSKEIRKINSTKTQIERKEKDKIKKELKKNELKIIRRLEKIKNAGLLPQDHHNLETEQHREIYYLTTNQHNLSVQEIIHTYINDTNVETKQKYIHEKLIRRIKHPYYIDKGKFMDIKPEEIIINEYCPFLGVKIDYRTIPKKIFLNNSHSIDRIVNGKGYIKNNVWVISRLANIVKNDSTIDELKIFCKNIILMYANKTNIRF